MYTVTYGRPSPSRMRAQIADCLATADTYRALADALAAVPIVSEEHGTLSAHVVNEEIHRLRVAADEQIETADELEDQLAALPGLHR